MPLLSYLQKEEIEAGCDEAGRGCLAGPVYAAAVILPNDFHHPLLNDSKLVSEAKREVLRPIIESTAIAWAVAAVTPKKIDKINIANASFLAMHKAIAKLSTMPTSLLIDGNRFQPYELIPHHCIIKGDRKYAAIAAASILAKTHRDAYMKRVAKKFPHYNWEHNKGYPTVSHRAAIKKYGTTKYHRMSFKLV